VSDSFDQRVLTTYLEEYFGDFLFDTFQPFRFYVGRDGDSIGLPPTGPRDVYTRAIDALPLVQSPEVCFNSLELLQGFWSVFIPQLAQYHGV
jgi:dynein heavy chain